MGDVNSIGFTLSSEADSDFFTTQFQGITGTEGGSLIYTKPTQTPTTHTVITNYKPPRIGGGDCPLETAPQIAQEDCDRRW